MPCCFSRLATLSAAVAGSLTWEAMAIRTVVTEGAALTDQDDWSLYDRRKGPLHNDIVQGSLGDCYYLAGLAALARTHPETIKQAFVTKGEINSLGRSIYQLRFMVDGETKIVAIDDSIPMDEEEGYETVFYFAKLGAGEEVWPALLEKGFAKLFGSYFAIRGGWAFQTFKAITQAPVDILQEASGYDMYLFAKEAHENNWPVTGGSIDNDFGTASGHAFVILNTGTKEGQLAIQVYNPWGTSNQYEGELKHLSSQDVGDYWLTVDEFGKAFDMVTRARVLPNAQLSSISIPVGSAFAVQFKTKLTRSKKHENPDFYVQLEWPDEKVLPEGCVLEKGKSTLSLRVGLMSAGPKGAVDGRRPAEDWDEISNLRATLPAKAGTYVALVGSFFDEMPGVEKVVMNVYAEEPVEFELVPIATAVKSLYGLCDDVRWEDMHFKRAADFRGSPAWETVEIIPAKAKNPSVLWIDNEGLKISPTREKADRYYQGFEASDLTCVDLAARNIWDNCEWVTFDHAVRLYRDGEFAGAPIFTDHKSVMIYFGGGQWTVTKPNVFNWYWEKGTEHLKCRVKKPKTSSLVQAGEEQEDIDEEEKEEMTEATAENLLLPDQARAQAHALVEMEAKEEVKTRRGLAAAKQRVGQATKECDQELLAKNLKRYSNLNNFEELKKKKDSLFPEQMKSIGDPDKDCGDSATGEETNCSELNHWRSITEMFGKPDVVPRSL